MLRSLIAARPFDSIGHGCDVLVHLSDNVPEFWRLYPTLT